MPLKKIILSLFILIFSQMLFAQNISVPEVWWAFQHPFAALKARKVSQVALKEAIKFRNENYPQSKLSGDFCDAYKHTLWMYMLSEKIGTKKAHKLGIAHEKGNYRQFRKGKIEDGELPDSLSSVMDLWNNDLGIELYKSNEKATNRNELIVESLQNGKGRMMLMNNEGKYLSCNKELIITKPEIKQWSIPKCLIPTTR